MQDDDDSQRWRDKRYDIYGWASAWIIAGIAGRKMPNTQSCDAWLRGAVMRTTVSHRKPFPWRVGDGPR